MFCIRQKSELTIIFFIVYRTSLNDSGYFLSDRYPVSFTSASVNTSFDILRFHLTVLYLSSSSSDNKERFCKVYSIKFFKRVISPIEYYNKHLAHNGLNILLGNRALMQLSQYRRQKFVLQYYIKRELPLLFSYFRTLSMEMLQDITESLLNQMHISCRNVKNVGWPLLTGFFHHIECKVLEDSVITVLVGCGKNCLNNRFMN